MSDSMLSAQDKYILDKELHDKFVIAVQFYRAHQRGGGTLWEKIKAIRLNDFPPGQPNEWDSDTKQRFIDAMHKVSE